MSQYNGSNVQAVLEALSRAMGVDNRVGAQADAMLSSESRIVWVPRSSTFARPEEQPEDGHAVAEERIVFDVSIHAPDFHTFTALTHKLIAAGLVEFSENAFDPFGSSPIKGGVGDAQAFGRTHPVMLCVPVYSELYTTAKAGPPADTAIVNSPAGADGEALP